MHRAQTWSSSWLGPRHGEGDERGDLGATAGARRWPRQSPQDGTAERRRGLRCLVRSVRAACQAGPAPHLSQLPQSGSAGSVSVSGEEGETGAE